MGNVPGVVVLSPGAARLRVTSVVLPHVVVELRFVHRHEVGICLTFLILLQSVFVQSRLALPLIA